MIPPEILRQVRRIEIYTNRIVNETFAGRYESVFKGRGVEFDEVREYQPGDDIRSIDWNVTARTGSAHIKRFVEERELTILFLVDLSRSMTFGSGAQLKHRLATELCAVLAFSAMKNHDKVGVLLFTDRIERYIPPKKGPRHVLRVIREVLSCDPVGHGTDLHGALEYLGRVTRRRAVAFLISDFFCEESHAKLAVMNRRHDVIAVHLVDPREETLPQIGRVRLEDRETGNTVILNTARASVRQGYEQWATTHRQRLSRMLQRAGVDHIEVRTDRPYLQPLVQFFAMRAARR